MIDLIIMSQWIMNHESIYILNVYILIYKRINILELLCFAKYKHTNIHTYIYSNNRQRVYYLLHDDVAICRYADAPPTNNGLMPWMQLAA